MAHHLPANGPVAERLCNKPLGLHPQHWRAASHTLARYAAAAALTPASTEADSRPYLVCDGIAIVAVRGMLIHRLGSIRMRDGCTGYDGIRAQLAMALADPEVRAIALDCDSFGGEVAGCFDLVDHIFAARGTKPIWAILDECAYSAAYAIASAADRVIVPRTGGAGSVGVILLHTDLSRMLDAVGITVTVIRYGDQKAEANAYEALPKDALERLQADVDAMGELFVATVARNRGLAVKAVRAQQAATYLGALAVGAGLADAVGSPADAFATFRASLGA